MGCCFSSPGEGPNSPYPGGAADDPAASSTRPINNSNNANAASGTRTAAQGTTACAAATAATSTGTTTASADPTSNSGATRHHRRRAHRHTQQPLSQHINKPLRRHAWASPSALSTARRGAGAAANRRRWSRRAIDRERADFFDTRVTGRAEVWQALRAALDILWEADRAAASGRRRRSLDADGGEPGGDEGGESGGQEDDADDVALATAQSILDAGEITLPTGDLAQGAYDALGNYYSLPEWIVSDPSNMVPDGDGDDHSGEKELDDDLDGATTSECTETEGEGEVLGSPAGVDNARDGGTSPRGAEEKKHRGRGSRHRREEKGKAVAHGEADDDDDDDDDDDGDGEGEKDVVAVRARLSENGRDVVVRVGRADHVKALERRILDKAQLAPTAKIRIAYLGKILREHSSLASQGWQEGHIVNALVFHNR